MQASHLALWRLGRSWAAEQHCRAELQAQRYARAAPRRYRRSLPRLRLRASWLATSPGGHLAPPLDGGFDGGFGAWDCSLECTHVVVAARARVRRLRYLARRLAAGGCRGGAASTGEGVGAINERVGSLECAGHCLGGRGAYTRRGARDSEFVSDL
ncbi:hypothetical protein B0H14DRAFT_350979 [Mycena olivaceomarginata]|nr:hypothetical protein B0H14DRAFT_350979 [Mycena olivaceomarginata]